MPMSLRRLFVRQGILVNRSAKYPAVVTTVRARCTDQVASKVENAGTVKAPRESGVYTLIRVACVCLGARRVSPDYLGKTP